MQINQGLRLVHSGSVTQTNMKLASIDAGAMIDIGVDWSAYAGTDVGSTPHLLVLYDSAGKRLQGFIGASGGGEVYGAELITGDNSNFTGSLGDWSTNNTWNSQTNPAANMVLAASDPAQYTFLTLSILKGALYKLTYDATGVVSVPAFTWWAFVQHNICSAIINGSRIAYCTKLGDASFLYIYSFSASSEATVDNILLKRVTDVSTNGVHLHSTKGGTNRNVASIDSAFDLNCVGGCDFKIYRCP